jgi:threonyl-tRNA synthetase
MHTMQQLEWVDYEPASDKGHFRFYPKGSLIRRLLATWCEQLSIDTFGALPIQTPFLYRSDTAAVREHIGIFSESVYSVIQGQDEFVLRFNDDLGLYTVMKDAQITYGHMPFRIYEQTHSFRYLESGGVSGIQKARHFLLNDVHSFCPDLGQGLIEYREIHRLMMAIASELGLCPVTHFQVPQSFYPEVKATMTAMLNGEERMLVEIIPRQKQYWIMKHIVHTHHMQRLFHVQFDLESSERFGIHYKAIGGSKGNYTVIHSSLGTIERWMLIILEDALKKDPPVLPLWLAPTQVRIIPVSEEKHLDYCLKVAEELKGQRIRVDVDDRNESMGWRIRGAEREWVPYVVVCGDKEQAGGPLSVRIRGAKQQQMSVAELALLIQGQTTQMPFSHLSGMRVSKRPVFRGRD